MNWSRERLKEMAKIALHGSYWKCVLVSLLLAVTAGGAGGGGLNSSRELFLDRDTSSSVRSVFGGIFQYGFVMMVAMLVLLFAGILVLALRIFVFGPLEVGCQNFFRQDLYRPVDLHELKAGFTPNYWNVVKIQFLRGLFTFLWSLLFVIPGIIKGYEYMMIPYILSENPNLSTEEAFALSKRMMDGEKWEAFVLDLSFIGWHLLSGITFGIVGIFYVNPYVDLTHAALYGALKQKIEMEETRNEDPYRNWNQY